MRTIINLLGIVVIAVVGYNYFFGSQSEKSESQEIVNQVKDLGKSIGDLLKSEKEKFDEGKYDGIFDRMRSVFEKMKSQLDSTDTSGREKMEDLEKELNDLEQKMKDAGDSAVSEETRAEWRARMNELMEKADSLLKE